MTKYYSVSYNNNTGLNLITNITDPSIIANQSRTAQRDLLSADGISYAGKLVYFNANAFLEKNDVSSAGSASIQHNLYIYEGNVFVGSISYLHCFENTEVKFLEQNILSYIVQASGKFIGSFGLPVYLSVDNETGNRNITFQYV